MTTTLKKLICFLYTHDSEWNGQIETDRVKGEFRTVDATYKCNRCGFEWQRQECIIDRDQYPRGAEDWLRSSYNKNRED